MAHGPLVCVFVRVMLLGGVMPLLKNEMEILLSRYQKLPELGP